VCEVYLQYDMLLCEHIIQYGEMCYSYVYYLMYVYCDVHAVSQQSTVETLVYNCC
jgi:hypothetical protein